MGEEKGIIGLIIGIFLLILSLSLRIDLINAFIPYWKSFGSPIYEYMILIFGVSGGVTTIISIYNLTRDK